MSIYETDLDANEANHVPLSPISFLRRAAQIYPHRMAVVQGSTRRTWGEVWPRCVAVAPRSANRNWLTREVRNVRCEKYRW